MPAIVSSTLICNHTHALQPLSPSYPPPQDLKALLQLPVLVVLDEAYIEFADEPSRIK